MRWHIVWYVVNAFFLYIYGAQNEAYKTIY